MHCVENNHMIISSCENNCFLYIKKPKGNKNHAKNNSKQNRKCIGTNQATRKSTQKSFTRAEKGRTQGA